MAKIYKGDRSRGRTKEGGRIVTVFHTPSNRTTQLSPKRSLRLQDHSPDGFEWGYGGSGPSQLALAILLDVTGNKNVALRHYHNFKWDVIAQLDTDLWEMPEERIKEWLESQEEDE